MNGSSSRGRNPDCAYRGSVANLTKGWSRRKRGRLNVSALAKQSCKVTDKVNTVSASSAASARQPDRAALHCANGGGRKNRRDRSRGEEKDRERGPQPSLISPGYLCTAGRFRRTFFKVAIVNHPAARLPEVSNLPFYSLARRCTRRPQRTSDRDRGAPRGAAPPTPPGIRVRTTAVRSG